MKHLPAAIKLSSLVIALFVFILICEVVIKLFGISFIIVAFGLSYLFAWLDNLR